MITKLTVKNFKRLDIDLDLASAVVFVGPNNSGKTSALQAITLWDLGLRKWAETRKKSKAKQRIGVTINKKDLFAAAVPSAKQLWKNLHVRQIIRENGKQQTKNINIEIHAEGFTKGKKWSLGFEFDYANPESFYCRMLPDNNDKLDFPEQVLEERIGLLPPMSGLSAKEDKLGWGSINSRIGEGLTAEVLRNLCWQIWDEKNGNWDELVSTMQKFGGVKINNPNYDNATGTISMTYTENDREFDICNAGRGFHQMLLIFSYIYAGRSSILLLDEPDAHLEIIRQKEIFNTLADTLKRKNSQLIIATHSEAVLNEASDKDQIIAFLGKPHIVNSKSQLVKSLTQFGFEQYLLAEQEKRVLYLEGSTDLAILKGFAEVLQHPAKGYLSKPFVWYMGNTLSKAREHFFALKEAVPELKGLAIVDNTETPLQDTAGLKEMMWKRREIENYLPIPEIVEGYVLNEMSGDSLPLFHNSEAMKKIIEDRMPPAALKNKSDPWWFKSKMSDDFLDIVFRNYFEKMNMPILMKKGDYHLLLRFTKPEHVDKEVKENLDEILKLVKSV